MKINFDASIPIYQQIIDQVRKAVARGELKPGTKLPSQRELARSLQVNPNTVQRAYREMEQAQLVETLRGQGTFIRDNPSLFKGIQRQMAQELLDNFLREMRSIGFTHEEILELIKKELRERRQAFHENAAKDDRQNS
jgi:GntR family transcriptional regulator